MLDPQKRQPLQSPQAAPGTRPGSANPGPANLGATTQVQPNPGSTTPEFNNPEFNNPEFNNLRVQQPQSSANPRSTDPRLRRRASNHGPRRSWVEGNDRHTRRNNFATAGPRLPPISSICLRENRKTFWSWGHSPFL